MMCNFKQDDYPHHLRQIDIFQAWHKTGIHPSAWYVFGICWKKKTNAVCNLVNTGFGIQLVYKSHRKSFLCKLRYTKWYMTNLVYMSYTKKPYKVI